MFIDAASLDKLIALKQTVSPSLKNVILFEGATQEQIDKGLAADLKIYSYPQIISIGKEHPEIVLESPTPETVFMFCYTSGTTGDPKGAMLKHKAFLAAL
jgi:long-chain acyl-CoA synthetase